MLRIKEKPSFPANSIGPLRIARNMTMDALAEAIGTDASTVNKLEKSRMRLTDKWLLPLSRALDASTDEILRDPSAPAVDDKGSTGDIRPANMPTFAPTHLPNDLPVRGTAAGSHVAGAFQLDGGIIDYVRRPPALLGAMNAFGLYVEGVSMVPEHNPGDLRFAHPDRPPRIGDSVVVEIQTHPNAPVTAMIGHLLRRTEKAVYIGKLNPQATVELKRETVVRIHKMLTMNELFGV